MGNPSPAFKFLHGDCHTWSRSTKHEPKELLGERDFMAVQAIISHQQPACESFFDLVASVGKGGLGGLPHEGMSIVQQCFLQRDACFHRLPQFCCREALTTACYLDVGLMRR